MSGNTEIIRGDVAIKQGWSRRSGAPWPPVRDDSEGANVQDGRMVDQPPEYRSHAEHYASGAYAVFDQEHRAGGTFGISMFEVQQGAIETVDPSIPEILFGTALKPWESFEIDMGDGWRCHEAGYTSFVDVQPANTESRFRLPDLHLRFAVLDYMRTQSLLSDIGTSPASLDAVTNAFRPTPEAASCLNGMWRAAGAAKRGDRSANLALDGAFLQMLGHLLAEGGDASSLRALPAIGDARLARAVDYIEENVSGSLILGDIAAVAAMSPSHFARSFRTAIGESVSAYLRRRRFERARELVERTDRPLSLIAYESGYADQSHMRRAFKQRTGKAPSLLR